MNHLEAYNHKPEPWHQKLLIIMLLVLAPTLGALIVIGVQ